MRISFQPVSDRSQLAGAKTAYLSALLSPLDGMWEAAFIEPAPHFHIGIGGQQAGYCCVGPQNRLLQFYLSRQFAAHEQDVWQTLIQGPNNLPEGPLAGAIAGTNDPVALAHCLDFQKKVRVHTWLFCDDPDFSGELSPLAASHLFRMADGADLARALLFCQESVNNQSAWLGNYLAGLIERQELFLLEKGGRILATGECRVSESQPPFADLGMIVYPEYRGQGLGTEV
nr:hypothetical protein [Calditrichia bacterium]